MARRGHTAVRRCRPLLVFFWQVTTRYTCCSHACVVGGKEDVHSQSSGESVKCFPVCGVVLLSGGNWKRKTKSKSKLEHGFHSKEHCFRCTLMIRTIPRCQREVRGAGGGGGGGNRLVWYIKIWIATGQPLCVTAHRFFSRVCFVLRQILNWKSIKEEGQQTVFFLTIHVPIRVLSCKSHSSGFVFCR